jgi:hypothetical protein
VPRLNCPQSTQFVRRRSFRKRNQATTTICDVIEWWINVISAPTRRHNTASHGRVGRYRCSLPTLGPCQETQLFTNAIRSCFGNWRSIRVMRCCEQHKFVKMWFLVYNFLSWECEAARFADTRRDLCRCSGLPERPLPARHWREGEGVAQGVGR